MIFVFLGPIERAELAVNVADVRIIDVAIDDVGHDFSAALAIAGRLRQVSSRIGQRAERLERAAIQFERFRRGNAFAREHFFAQRIF